MLVYVFSTLLSMFFASLYKKNKTKNNKRLPKNIFAFLSALPLFLVAGLRFNVGYDYASYTNYFKLLLNGGNNDYFEVGFYHLTKAIQLFTSNYEVFFLILAFIFTFFTFKAIYKESPDPVLSIFLLVSTQYYFISMNAVRQFLALAIFLYSIKYIEDRKFMHFLTLMIITSFIHTASLVLIPTYFLYNIKIKPKYQMILLTVMFCMANLLKNFIYSFFIGSKYYYYIDINYGNHSAGYVMQAIELSVLILGWMFYHGSINESEEKNYNYYLNMKMISFYFALINSIMPLLYRIKWCFGFTTIIFIPLIIQRIEKKDKKTAVFAKTLIYFFFAIYIIYTVGVQNANTVLPYRTIFDN